ncbi:hypothetical protein HDU87_005139 [Geranomyces variabilis]|uniref:F-box domain-containing protein n=1 Tax=Geranomyces variabilis TaxID=109894 RepID=A0AAD5TSV5_9FUNG|nr:hypothetical protein HDU87_005139 [Geranomyces variabilis]
MVQGPASQAGRPSLVDRLPNELLLHILANLDHTELRSSMLVCSRFHRVISDDSCWRYAFEKNFGSLPIRRLGESSWQKEYIKRVQLLKGFYGGKHIVQFDPRIGNIALFFVNYDDGWMYAASLEKGMVAFCHPSTGRVEKGFVYFTDDRVPQAVASILLDRQRIAVGLPTGGVALVTDFKDRSNYAIHRFAGFHTGAVMCLAWVPTVPHLVISGGADGLVKIWDTRTFTCVRTLTGPGDAPVTVVACDKSFGVLAGTESGDVNVWAVDVVTLCEKAVSLPSLSSTSIATTNVLRFVERANTGPVCAIALQAERTFAVVVVASASKGSITQWDLQTARILAVCEGSHSAAISTAAWDQPIAKSAAVERDRLLLTTGDANGVICVWDIPKPLPMSDASTPAPSTLKPVRQFDAHRSSITVLRIDPFKIVSGALDGSVKVFDLLTSRPIRTLVVRRTRGGNDGLLTIGGGGVTNKKQVRCVWAGHHQVVVATGDRVTAWDFGAYSGGSATAGKGKKKHGPGDWNAGRAVTSKARRQNLQREQSTQIRDDVLETRWERDQEREEEAGNTRRARKFNGVDLLDGEGGRALSEEELTDLALMMSMEQLGAPSMDSDLMRAIEQSLNSGPARVESFGGLREDLSTAQASLGNEDEELRYALELSKVEH